jgi:hypothetical protein
MGYFKLGEPIIIIKLVITLYFNLQLVIKVIIITIENHILVLMRHKLSCYHNFKECDRSVKLVIIYFSGFVDGGRYFESNIILLYRLLYLMRRGISKYYHR